MMEQKKLVPKRRFKGFEGEWTRNSFKNFLDKSDGIRRGPFGSALKKEFFVPKSDYVVYEQQNAIYDTFNTRYYITKEKYDELHRFKLNEGDFILSGAGTIGRISRVPRGVKKGVINQALIRLKIDNHYVDSEFFLQWMRSKEMQKRLTETNPASAMANLVPMSEVKEWEVLVPNKNEQQKIGQFFKLLDKRIANQERKIAKVKALKSAYLTEMFPQEGETIPKRRFKEFQEEWNYSLLKDLITSEFKGKAKANMSGGTTPYLDTEYLNGGKVLFVTSPVDVEENDVLILWDGSNAGMVYHGFRGALGSTLKAYRPKYSGTYLYYYLIRYQQVIFENFRTPNIPHVINTFADEFVVCLPSIKEQQKIGQFFKNLDDQIATEERKLAKLKAMKEAYLEEMFV